MTSHTATGECVDGVHFERWGSGPPIVMIHGGGRGHRAGGREKWRLNGRRVRIGAGHHLPRMVDGGAAFNAASAAFIGEVDGTW